MDRVQFLRNLTKLAAVFRVPVDDVLVESYWEALRDWKPEALEGGARALIAGAKWFPKPVEWAEAAEEFMRQRVTQERQARLMLAQSTEPAISHEDVKRVVAELAERLQWQNR